MPKFANSSLLPPFNFQLSTFSFLLFSLLLLPTANIMGQTAKTWTGTTNTNWHTASNWNPAGVPQNNDPVTIPNVANDPILGQADTVASLTLQNAVPVNFGGYTLTVTNTAILANANLSNGHLKSGGISSNGANIGVRITNNAGNVNFVSSTFSKPIVATGGIINLNVLTFNDTVSITKTGSSTDQCQGGITANAPVTYINNGNGNFLIQSLTNDVYNGPVNIRNLVGGSVIFGRTGNTTCNGKLTINSTGGIACIGFHLTGVFNINGDIEFNCSNAYTIFEKFSLQSGKKILPISASNFSGGILEIRNGFNQLGADSITINGQNGARLFIQGATTTFRGVITANVPSLKLNGGIFHGKAFFTKTGSNLDQNDGGYTFMDDVSFTTTAGTLQLAYLATTCTYYGNLTLNCSGGSLSPAYGGTHNLKSNLIFAGSSAVGWGGTFLFSGSTNQSITRTNGIDQFVYNLKIDKASGAVNVEYPLSILANLNLVKGILDNGSNSLISLGSAWATVIGGNAESYIDGPVAKAGTTAFTFPIGRNGHYKPISITAPATNSTFRAEYTNKTAANGRPFTSKDASINRISSNEHWQLQRTTGTANVQPTVTWDNMSCQFNNMANLRLTAWNGSTWKDLGNGGTTGTTITGTIKTTSTNSIYGYYTLATTDTFRCVKCEADAGRDTIVDKYEPIVLGAIEDQNSQILWLPNDRLVNANNSQTILFPIITEILTKTVTNTYGCAAKDAVYVVVNEIFNEKKFLIPCKSLE